MSEDLIPPNAKELLDDVLKTYSQIENPRLRELVLSAASHIHHYVFETKLTRDEWESGLLFLTAVGQACREGRQEFILLSDLLGLSTAVDQTNYDAKQGDTPSSVEGPYFINGSPFIPFGGSIITDEMDDAERAIVTGHITNRRGEPIGGAVIDIWQTAPNQLYAAADPQQSEFNLRGRQVSTVKGLYKFETVKPVPYSVPRDGPAGRLIDISKEHGMRAAHIHISVSAEKYKTLTTQICAHGDPYLESDAAFSISAPLVVDFKRRDNGSLFAQFDMVLQDA